MKSFQNPTQAVNKVKLKCDESLSKQLLSSGVEAFRNPVIRRCYKCQRLGHIAKNCKETMATCIQCGKPDHTKGWGSYKGHYQDLVKKCVLCGGPHTSASIEC